MRDPWKAHGLPRKGIYSRLLQDLKTSYDVFGPLGSHLANDLANQRHPKVLRQAYSPKLMTQIIL